MAFASSPDLFLVAHEAAHVVQQRGWSAPATSPICTTGSSRTKIEDLRRRRRQLVRTAETDVREALRMANHAALSGSRNHRADAATERFRQIAWLTTFIDRCVGGPSGPDEQLRGLHEEIGQEYEPADAPQTPDVRL